MDPDANLRDQDELLRELAEYEHDGTTHRPAYENARTDLAERRQDLADWLQRGGFQPDWTRFPKAAAYFGKDQPVHYARTHGYQPACNGYLRDVPNTEPTTLTLHETTCPDCQELLETDPGPDDDVCVSCGQIGPWYGAPEATCPTCYRKAR